MKPLSSYLEGFKDLPIKCRSEIGVRVALDYHRIYGRYPPKRCGLNLYSPAEVKMILALRSLDRLFKTRIQVLIGE